MREFDRDALAAGPVHAGLSLGWAGVLARILSGERELVRALEQFPQWLDHVATGSP
jgi:hypothetical protein